MKDTRKNKLVRWHILCNGEIYETIYTSYKAALKRMRYLDSAEWESNGEPCDVKLEIIEEFLEEDPYENKERG